MELLKIENNLTRRGVIFTEIVFLTIPTIKSIRSTLYVLYLCHCVKDLTFVTDDTEKTAKTKSSREIYFWEKKKLMLETERLWKYKN